MMAEIVEQSRCRRFVCANHEKVERFSLHSTTQPSLRVRVPLILGVAWVRAASGHAPFTVAGVRGGRVIAAIILASQAWLVLAVWPEAAALRAHLDQVKHELVDNPRTNPRFWSHGWF